MALVDTLRGSLGDGGFDLSATLTSAGGVLDKIAPSLPDLDLSRIAEAAAIISSTSPAGVSDAVQAATQRMMSQLGELPAGADVLRPLMDALSALDVFAHGEAAALLETVHATAAPASRRPTVTAAIQRLDSFTRLALSPGGQAIGRLLELVLPGGVNPAQLAGTLSRWVPTIPAALRIVGGLAAAHAGVTRIDRTARAVVGQLETPALQHALGELARAADDTLPALIAAAHDGDATAVDAAEQALRGTLATLDAALADTAAAPAMAERALTFYQGAASGSELTSARTLFQNVDFAPIRSAAEGLNRRLLPLLSPLAANATADDRDPKLRAFFETLAADAGQLDVDRITAPLMRGLTSATRLTDGLARALTDATTASRAALDQVRSVARALPTADIAAQLQSLLRPVVQALASVQQAVAAGLDAMKRCLADTADAIRNGREQLEELLLRIDAAFVRLRGALVGLELDRLIDSVRPGVVRAAGALGTCRIKPYFDGAIEVMDGAQTVMQALPVSLLSAEQQNKVRELARPIKAIDFAESIAVPLRHELEQILASLNDAVLKEISDAFAEAREVVSTLKPHEHLQAFERERLDPVLARVAAITPASILQPLADAVAKARSSVSALDVSSLVQPLDEVFDRLLSAFDALAPAKLVAEPIARFAEIRARVQQLAAMDRWSEALESARTALDAQLARLDDRLLIVLRGALDALIQATSGPDGGAVLLEPLIRQALDGSGLDLRSDSVVAALDWIDGHDGAAALRSLLDAAIAQLASADAALTGIDASRIAAMAQPQLARFRSAVAALPEGGVARSRLEAVLAAISPLDRLGALATASRSLRRRLAAAHCTVAALAGSGMSDVTAAAQGLREALRPLSELRTAALGALGRLGAAPAVPGLHGVLAAVRDVLAAVTPASPLTKLLDVLRDKLGEALSQLADGAQQVARSATQALQQLDPTTLVAEVEQLHTTMRAELAALRPSSLLAEPLRTLDTVKGGLAAFDPAAALQPVVQELDGAVQALDALRPTVSLASALGAYDDVVALLAKLDVTAWLAPVLGELNTIGSELDSGLDQAASSLTKLQQALP